MKTTSRIYKAIALLLVLTFCTSMCGCTTFDNFKYAFMDNTAEKNDQIIYIGVYEPRTGSDSAKGNEEIKGIELANSIFSTVKGATVKLVYVDTQSDISASENAISNLIDMNPIAIIGSAGEASSLIASTYIETAKIPTITPSAINPLITESSKYYYRASMVESQKGNGLADYAINGLNSTNIYIASIKNNSAGDAIVEGFEDELDESESDDIIVSKSEILIDETDFGKLANKIITSGADTVFMPVGTEMADAIFTELEKSDVSSITFLGSQEWNTDAFVNMMSKHPNIKVAFPSDTVVIKNGSTVGTVTAETQRFLVEWTKKYGEADTPTDNAALGYDSYLLLINAINNAEELTSESVKEALDKTENLRCSTGVFTFGVDGNPVRTVNISTIHDGEVVSAYVTDDTSEANRMKKISK